MTGNHTRRTGAALRTLQMAAFPRPAKPSRRSGGSPRASSHRTGGTRLPRCIPTRGDTTNHLNPPSLRSVPPWCAWPPAAPRAATQRSRSLNDQFQVCSQEASTMAMTRKRPHTDDGAAVTGRAAARHPHVHRGPGGKQAPNAVGVAGCPIRVLRRPGGQS